MYQNYQNPTSKAGKEKKKKHTLGWWRWRRRGGEEVVVAGRGWRWPAAGEGGEDEWVLLGLER